LLGRTARWDVWTLVWLVATAAGRQTALAEPLVRVRGESRIEIGVAHTELGISISGALRDELGTPLARRALAIEALPENAPQEPWATDVRTDEAGRFSLEITDTDRNYRLLATFSGDDNHRGVRVERNVERARDDVRLELKLPGGPRIDLDQRTVAVDVVAESDASGARLAMRLTDETGRELAHGTTEADGRLRLDVRTELLGAPGAGLLRIESLRDERRAEAQTEARVVRTRAVELTLSPESSSFETGSSLRVEGGAHTRIAPRANVPVGLFANGRHLETVITDEQGAFRTRLWLANREGPIVLVARSEGDAASAYPAAETRVTLRAIHAEPLPVPWLLVAFGIATLGLWGFARLRARSLGDSLRPEVSEPQREQRILLRKPQGRRDRHRIHGRVQDMRDDAPVAFAKLSLVHEQPDGSCVLAADEQGRFDSPVLPSGRLRLRVESPGFVATEVDLYVPHRGEWSSFAVRLENLRERALSPFRRLALKVLPSSRAWGVWTTRETREWMSRAVPARRTELSDLTLDVERACYGEQPPSEVQVASIEERVQEVERGLRPAHDGPNASETRAAR
jgi:hypothetical protein